MPAGSNERFKRGWEIRSNNEARMNRFERKPKRESPLPLARPCVPKESADAVGASSGLAVNGWAESIQKACGDPLNLGLLFQKWLPCVPHSSMDGRNLKDSKKEILKSLVQTYSDGSLLNQLHNRLDNSLEGLRRGGLEVGCEKAVLVSRMVSRLGEPHPLETGFMFHPLYGVPFLPGSGLKGAVRAFVERQQPDAIVKELFGTTDSEGRAVFLDAFPCVNALEVDYLTVHFPGYYPDGKQWPSDDKNPIPVPFLTVPAGTQWVFRFALRPPCRGQQARTSLSMLREFVHETLEEAGLGAKRNSGYGVFSFSAPASASSPRRESPAPSSPSVPRPGQLVEAELVAEKTKKGGWKARHVASGRVGAICNSSEVPAEAKPGTRVSLRVRAWPEAGDVQFEWPRSGPGGGVKR